MTVRSRDRGRKRFFYFVCASYDHRGASVCANGLLLPMLEADEATLVEVSDVVLDPEIVTGAIEDAIAELRPSREVLEVRRQGLLAELRQRDDQQGRYVAAIAQAGEIDALVTALRSCEQERQRVQRDLAALDGLDRLKTFDVKRIERAFSDRVTEWRRLVRRQTPIARQVLAKFLDGRIVWTPRKDEGLYAFTGRATSDRLLSGIVFTLSPPGFGTERGVREHNAKFGDRGIRAIRVER